MNAPGVSIVVPTFNGKTLLARFLPSVMAAREAYPGPSEVIVVDDGGSDGSDRMIQSEFSGARLVRLKQNRGFSSACNAGFRHCVHPIVVLLNNDVLADRNFISPLTIHFTDKDVFGVRPGLTLLNDEAAAVDLDRFFIGLEFKKGLIELPMMTLPLVRDNREIFLLGGTSAAFDRKKLLALGGFDETFNPFYWEDADLSYRAWKRGWKIVFEPASRVSHQTHSTIFRLRRRAYIEMIAERNRYILVWKNITDGRLLARHFCWMPFRLAAHLITGRWHRLLAPFLALARLGVIIRRRQRELAEATSRDVTIFGHFAAIMKNATRIKP